MFTLEEAHSFCLEGKTQFTHAIWFHVAEERRLQRNDWEDSLSLYESLLDEYEMSKRRRSFFFLLSELLIQRMKATSVRPDPIFSSLCLRFIDSGLVADPNSGDFQELIFLARTKKTLVFVCVGVLHLQICPKFSVGWQKSRKWLRALQDCMFPSEFMEVLSSCTDQPENLLDSMLSACSLDDSEDA